MSNENFESNLKKEMPKRYGICIYGDRVPSEDKKLLLALGWVPTGGGREGEIYFTYRGTDEDKPTVPEHIPILHGGIQEREARFYEDHIDSKEEIEKLRNRAIKVEEDMIEAIRSGKL